MSPVSRSVSRPVSRSILAGQSNTLASIIKSIFANNEQGFAYDPNDLSTMFQDSAGTIPVTGAGQPVGLMLDKSRGLSLDFNLLSVLDFTTWSTLSGPIITPDSFTVTSTGGVTKNIGMTVGKFYKVDIVYESSNPAASLTLLNGSNGGSPIIAISTTGIMSCVLNAVSAAIYLRAANTTITIKSISFREIAGNHAYQSVSSSRPILQRNATTGAYYLAFDGVDDFLQTNNIDFTATDKVGLFAGLRKLSDVTGMLMELSATADSNPNSFYLAAPLANGSAFRFYTKAAASTSAVAVPMNDAPSPISCVTTVKSAMVNGGDITLKVNQQSYATKNTTAIGNYGNYPLYIGRRGGTSLPFNGHLYSLIGIGRLTTDVETASIEKLIAKNTGVTLSV